MSLYLLSKDIINIIIVKCTDYSEWSKYYNMYCNQPALLKYIARFALTCKYINQVAQKFINDHTYTYHIFQKAIIQPDIIDQCGVVYKPHSIGNALWFLCIKSSCEAFMYVDKEYYDFYGQSDRYFEENCIYLQGNLKSTTIKSQSMVKSRCFTIHYKAQFGEILLLTWYYPYYNHIHHHIKMTWTEGDVWVGIIHTEYSDTMYRYEVCIDHGGPIIRKENIYRPLRSVDGEMNNLISDVWDYPAQLNFK